MVNLLLIFSARIILILSFIAFLVVNVRKYRYYQEIQLRVLIALSVFGIILSILELNFINFEVFTLFELLIVLFIYAALRLVFLFTILLYFEFHHVSKLSPWVITVGFSSILISSTTLLLLIYQGYFDLIELNFEIISIAPFLGPPIGFGILFCFIKLMKYIYDDHQKAVNAIQKRQLQLFSLGLIVWFVLPNLTLPFVIFSNTLNTDFNILVINVIMPLLVATGVFITTFSLLLSKQVIVPGIQFIDNFMIVDKSGMLLYSYKFKEVHNTEEVLLSGGLSAISSLLQEAIGVESNLSSINFQDKEVMISPKENLGFIIITDHRTRYLEHALDKISNAYFERDYPIKAGVMLADNEILPLLQDSFGLFEGIN